jgi:cytochrome c peroxidase
MTTAGDSRRWRRALLVLGAFPLAWSAWMVQVSAHQALDPAVLRLIPPASAAPLGDPQDLIERGRLLFSQETFGGNGRTCASCHPPANNFTVDAKYIAKLNRKDPLFVAEWNPKLAELENPQLLRRFGLFTENLDGFDQPGVLRSAPHTLGMQVSIAPDKGDGAAGRDPFALAAATGWSGDGAPGDGSLRMFAVGAVVQHMPKTLRRVPGKDFRLPTEDELTAMLAYQLSLGRQAEIVVDPAVQGALAFRDIAVEDGRRLFHGAPTRASDTRSCGGCHAGAGANDKNGNNRQFATGVSLLPNAPACLAPGVAPGDGGFGSSPIRVVDGKSVCGGTKSFPITLRGNEAFNTPPLVEAADTPPYFHNNAAATLEDAVAFYTTDTFNASPAGAGRAFILTEDEIRRIAAFLRALNAVRNVDEAIASIDSAKSLPAARAKLEIEMASAQVQDAIEVLTTGPLKLFTQTQAAASLKAAQLKLGTGMKLALLAGAKVDLTRARGLMVQ